MQTISFKMALMFDVRPTCIYRHLYQRYTRQCDQQGRHAQKKQKNICPNYREFRVSDVRIIEVSL
jgi:hypothetical protein